MGTTKISPKIGQRRINIKQESFTHDIPNSVEQLESTSPLEGTLAFTDYTVAADLQDLDDKIKSMMEVSENCDGRNRKKRICKVCGKERPYNEMKQHIEANHIYGVSHICNTCGKTMRSRSALRQHNSKEHRYEAVIVFKELEPNFSHSVPQKSVCSSGLNRSKLSCYLSVLHLYTRIQKKKKKKKKKKKILLGGSPA